MITFCHFAKDLSKANSKAIDGECNSWIAQWCNPMLNVPFMLNMKEFLASFGQIVWILLQCSMAMLPITKPKLLSKKVNVFANNGSMTSIETMENDAQKQVQSNSGHKIMANLTPIVTKLLVSIVCCLIGNWTNVGKWTMLSFKTCNLALQCSFNACLHRGKGNDLLQEGQFWCGHI